MKKKLIHLINHWSPVVGLYFFFMICHCFSAFIVKRLPLLEVAKCTKYNKNPISYLARDQKNA